MRDDYTSCIRSHIVLTTFEGYVTLEIGQNSAIGCLFDLLICGDCVAKEEHCLQMIIEIRAMRISALIERRSVYALL